MPQLVQRSGDHRQLKPFYRGWAGGTEFEQIAERAVWMDVGWDWLTHAKKVRTGQKGLTGIKRLLYPVLRPIPINLLQLWLDRWTSDATWVKVDLIYQSLHRQGRYQVTVAEADKIITARNSAKTKDAPIQTTETQQYRVTQLTNLGQENKAGA